MSTGERILAVVVVLIVFVAFVVSFARSYRRGGTGPPIFVAPFTRRGRERVNRTYAKHGWAEPFDEEGNMLPADQRKPPARR